MSKMRIKLVLGVIILFLFAPFPIVSNKNPSSVNKKNINNPEMERKIYSGLRTYAEVVSLIEKKAFRGVDFSKFIEGSLKSAANNVDAHSSFLTKDSFKTTIESTSGEFSGIGVSIFYKAPDDDALTIIDVIPEGPSSKAGLKGGDKIVEVNGEKLKGLSTDEAVGKLKGKIGSGVIIKVLRDKRPLEFKVTRDIIKDQNSLCFHFKDQGVYYLSLKIFAENSSQHISKLLQKSNEGKCKGVILDLRRNPGGTLQSAIDMAGLFLDKNSLVVSTKDKNQKIIERYFTKTNPVLRSNTPFFILIDNFTASAAEILAGCLRHYSAQGKNIKNKRNLLVFLAGSSSFGKGSVQEVIPLSNGCALKLTTMLYYLPNDESIQAKGIEPDFKIKPRFIPDKELKWVTEMFGKELSLKNHITVQEATGKPITKDKKESSKIKNLIHEVKTQSDLFKPKKLSHDHNKDNKPTKDKLSAENWGEMQQKALRQDSVIQAAVNMINLLCVAKKNTPKLVQTRHKALGFLKQHYLTDNKISLEKVN